MNNVARIAFGLLLLVLSPTLEAQDARWSAPADGGSLPTIAVGDDAPAFSLRAYNEDVALRLVKSPLVGLSFFVGLRPEFPSKVVLLGFFTAWDARGQEDLAVLQKLYKKYKGDGVAVLMISLDNKDLWAVYDSFEKAKVTYPVLKDRFGVVSKRYGISQLPTLMIIDKDAKVVSIGEGYRDNVEGYLDQQIKTLLGVE